MCQARVGGQYKVPHTWQVEAPLAEYYGVAWYRRTFDVRPDWQNSAVRVEFEAVFHTATVWINGQLAGEHRGKGYTAFTFDVTHLLHWGEANAIAVRVDNAFNEHMLPRGRSSDWAHDGGIFRPVQLLITPKVFVERLDVEATPNLTDEDATIAITSYIRNTSHRDWSGGSSFRIVDEASGLTVLKRDRGQVSRLSPEQPKRWRWRLLCLKQSCGTSIIPTCIGFASRSRGQIHPTAFLRSLASADWRSKMARSI